MRNENHYFVFHNLLIQDRLKFNLLLRDFEQHLPDRIHFIHVGELEIPSKSEGFYLKNISLLPYQEKAHPTKTKIIQQLSNLSIAGLGTVFVAAL